MAADLKNATAGVPAWNADRQPSQEERVPAEVKIRFPDQSRGTRPSPKSVKVKNDNFTFCMVLWLLILALALFFVCAASQNNHISGEGGGHEKFKCSFINETMTGQKNATETCEALENAPPYCFGVFHQNMKTANHKISSAGCWSRESGENDQCIRVAKESDSKSACIVQKISSSHQVIFCCCLSDMCNSNFKTLPSIFIKQK